MHVTLIGRFFVTYFAALGVALLAAMPHSRSVEAAARRHERALRLGFWRPQAPDKRFVQAAASVADSAKLLASSFQVHRRLELTGVSFSPCVAGGRGGKTAHLEGTVRGGCVGYSCRQCCPASPLG